ncbi:LysR family transcriptional regulator [Devosia nitrariae]|uniref:Transcriptional regulator n=1 Tax=Devosia nitrariae TaxID=2071872 RepID=A0ABQ5W3X8_9HYPH|nr:LysR family transcriptional regulator [Devosia nitrariae]GLQ54770.1 transcriptional regulator [Devosia nitrariae]
MEMHEIRYFLAACETLNFHRAADLAHVTQPALTRAIQKLEGDLGGLLFRREHNHVQLTDFGRLMRTHLEEVYRRSELARETARSFLRLEDAPLTLGVMCTIGPLRFIGFLNAFRERYPGIGVTMMEGVPSTLTQLLLDGKLDIALMAQPQTFDERLTSEPIYRERFGLAFASGHPYASRNTLQLSDVEGEPYLSRINCEYRGFISELCTQRGIEISVAYRSEREDWIMAMVAAGMGICFAPEFSVTLPGVMHRPVGDPEIVREVSLVSVAGRTLSPAIAGFAETVRSYNWGA